MHLEVVERGVLDDGEGLEEGGDEESAVRVMLRDGWRLHPKQPDALLPFYADGIVGVLMSKERAKPTFVCSLCSKQLATQPAFVKHLGTHRDGKGDKQKDD